VAAGFVFGLVVTALYNGINPDGALGRDPHAIAPWQYFIKFNPILRLPEFLTGMACGVLFLHAGNGNGRSRHFAWPLTLAGIGMIAVVAAVLHRNPWLILQACVVAPAFAAIVYGVALGPSGLGVLEKRFFVLLGDASYSFYLLHTMIIGAFAGLFHDAAGNLRHQNPLWFLLPVATIALIAILVYKFIETPMRRVLRPKRKGIGQEVPAVVPLQV
jgi:peptidoglycan/LPS O-acetylase OafA/YrhL